MIIRAHLYLQAILEDVGETSAAHAVDEANVALTRSELESEECFD